MSSDKILMCVCVCVRVNEFDTVVEYPRQLKSLHWHSNRLERDWLFYCYYRESHVLNHERCPNKFPTVHTNYPSIQEPVLCMWITQLVVEKCQLVGHELYDSLNFPNIVWSLYKCLAFVQLGNGEFFPNMNHLKSE